MSDEFYDRLLAQAVRPERPSAAVEEDLLLRLEQEIYRRRSNVHDDDHEGRGDQKDDVGDDGFPGVVVEIGKHHSTRQAFRFQHALAVAAILLVVGVAILGDQGRSTVRTDVSDEAIATSPPTSDIEIEADSTAESIDSINVACAALLPNLAPGTTDVIGTGTTAEAEALVRERVADLRLLANALDEPVSALGAAKPELANRWNDIVAELQNSELLLSQGVFDGGRYTVPAITSDLHRLLDELVDDGADDCGLWAKPQDSGPEQQTEGE